MDLDCVITGSPWLFNKHLLVSQTIKPAEDPLQIPLVFVDVWVLVHDLKPGYISESITVSLGNFVGSFVEYNSTFTSFIDDDELVMRIRVKMGIRNPLRRRKKLADLDGSFFYTHFSYERIHVFCYFREKLGHTDSFCDLLLHKSKCELKPLWGANLHVVVRRHQLSLSS